MVLVAVARVFDEDSLSCPEMYFHEKIISFIVFYLLLSWTVTCCFGSNRLNTKKEMPANSLEKLIKLFSTPGAFERIDEILGNTIEPLVNSCPDGDEGLDCRRAEARRSIDCPTGDCYCHDCADAGPDLWTSCCRESSKCCSHLAAACRNCDHPKLIPFCTKHFKKCLHRIVENVK